MFSIQGERILQQENDKPFSGINNRSYFFDKGLKFECAKCGSCCNGAPGIIIVLDEEISHISEFLELDRDLFIERCLYPYLDGYSIREDDTGRCIFFENGCAIYPTRPLQCRTFPFWFTNLRSEKTWKTASLSCPGIGKGRLYTKEELLEIIMASLNFYKPFCHALGLIEKK
jgi:Fe-S-cluster containining protein